ncbi:phospholipase DDHD1-like isoform X2 [Ptychodera flava]|uniref:phospholipase DDHD1-like isoform X2 n=1 Tax=Ptychodera flava TaxID=63121 RepID=UPI00396A9B31
MDYPTPGDQATRDDDEMNDDSLEASSNMSVPLEMEVEDTVNSDAEEEVTPVDTDAEDRGEEMRDVAAGKLTISIEEGEGEDDDVIIIEDSEESGEQEETVSKPEGGKEEEAETTDDGKEKEDANGTESSAKPPKRNKINVGQPTDIVQDLNARQVRWFYRESKDERKWNYFSGYDSLQIEWKYREVHFHCTKTDDDVEMIIVRGGLYEVDVVSRKCYPIYWQAEAFDVMRGTWFYDTLQPLEESLADDIEQSHLEKFRGQNKNDPPETLNIKGNKPVLHHLKLKGSHIDWNTITDVFQYSDTARSKLARSIGTSIGLSKASSSGTKLTRGYCLEASLEDKPPPITHLVFVVHGIGQKMDSSSIIKSCSDLRASAIRMINKHLPSLVSRTSTKRVEFLPCEWRSNLKLDGDMTEAITPHRLRGLRAVLNSSAMDIMYYTSPLYRSEIVRGLQSELNRLYKMFCDRNPGFEANDGKVSVISHSLGSVITYDILTGWNPIHLYDQYLSHEQANHPDLDEVDAEQEVLAQELRNQRQKVEELESKLLSKNQVAAVTRMPTLNFKVENMFCLGSPLAVFLSMRGVRPHGKGKQDVILPKSQCQRLFNIYHPADPVAYRIEPLLIKHYSTIMPLKINSSDSGRQKRYSDMTMMAYPAAKDKPKEMQSTKGPQYEMVDMKDMIATEPEKKPAKSSDEETSSDQEDVEHSEHFENDHASALPSSACTVAFNATSNTTNSTSPASSVTSIACTSITNSVTSPVSSCSNGSSRRSSCSNSAHGSPLRSSSSYPIFTSVYDEMSSSISASLTGFWSKWTKKSESVETNAQLQVFESMKEIAAKDEKESKNEKGIPVNLESVELEHRIDYELREGTMENAYLSAVTSHTAYWTSADVVLFILVHLFPDYLSTSETSA